MHDPLNGSEPAHPGVPPGKRAEGKQHSFSAAVDLSQFDYEPVTINFE